MKTLSEIYNSKNFDTDKNTLHSYIDYVYSELFSEIQISAKNILEIGIDKGGSIFLWKEYFLNANINAIDIEDKKEIFNNNEQLKIFKANAYDDNFINSLPENYFDLIIEQNEFFCNDDPTGGVSNGVDPTWVVSFDSGPETAYRFYSGEEPPRSANTETVICYTCFSDVNNGNAFYYTNSVPHPVYTDGYGTPVTQLDMVTLGGVNGLNN